jgi:hypothetical protein
VGGISRTIWFTESWVDRLLWAVQCGVVAFSPRQRRGRHRGHRGGATHTPQGGRAWRP